VRIESGMIVSEDLDLDLWVSADGDTILRLDEADFEASGLSRSDPEAAGHALSAIEELERRARNGFEEIADLD
jgi:hypothetical protein